MKDNKWIKMLTSKIVHCPRCQKSLRLPIRIGKKLEVSCPECKHIFYISFQDWPKPKWSWLLWIGVGLIIIILTVSHFSASIPPALDEIIEDSKNFIGN